MIQKSVEWAVDNEYKIRIIVYFLRLVNPGCRCSYRNLLQALPSFMVLHLLQTNCVLLLHNTIINLPGKPLLLHVQ